MFHKFHYVIQHLKPNKSMQTVSNIPNILKTSNKNINKGIGLIEALISMVVFMIGLVGVLKLLNVSVNSTQTSEAQGAVAILVEDASERLILLANNSNQIGINSFLNDANCDVFKSGTTADVVKLMQCQNGVHSRQEWNANLTKSIPNAKATISRTGINNSIEVKILWQEKVTGNASKKSSNTLIDRTHLAMVDF